MSWFTDWFIADEADAEAVASIASEDGHSFEDWPHLPMKSVGEMELMLLRGILRGRPGDTEEFHGDALYCKDDEEGGVAVTPVLPAFLAELTALPVDQAARVAVQWHQTEAMADWEPGTVAEVLRQAVEFARRAGREGKPVLQLSTW